MWKIQKWKIPSLALLAVSVFIAVFFDGNPGLVDSMSKIRAFLKDQRDLVDCAKVVLIPVAWYIDIIALLAGVTYGGCLYGPLGALAGFFVTQAIVLYKIGRAMWRQLTIWLSSAWETEPISARKVEEFKRQMAKTKTL